VPSLGIGWRLGIDGISYWLVILTTALTPISLFVSWNAVSTKVKSTPSRSCCCRSDDRRVRRARPLPLLRVLGADAGADVLIIGIWGGKDASTRREIFLYTFVGSLLMLVAILYVVAQYHTLTGNYSFAWGTLQSPAAAGRAALLFIAFASRRDQGADVPLHTWLPDAHVQAPTGGSVILRPCS